MKTRIAACFALSCAVALARPEYWVATLGPVSGKVWLVPRTTAKQRLLKAKHANGVKLHVGDRFRLGPGGSVSIQYVGTVLPVKLHAQNGYCVVERRRDLDAASIGHDLDAFGTAMGDRGVDGLAVLGPVAHDSIPLSQFAITRTRDQASAEKIELYTLGSEKPIATIELKQGQTDVKNHSATDALRARLRRDAALTMFISAPGEDPENRRPFFVLSRNDEAGLSSQLEAVDAAYDDPFQRNIGRAATYLQSGCVLLGERELTKAWRIHPTPGLTNRLTALASALGDTDTVAALGTIHP